jgi:hypothetical protein
VSAIFHVMTTRTELRGVPGVGAAVEADLHALGIHRVRDLEGRDPEELYARLCALQGGPVDRCMLYTLRCAVYFAETPDGDPELLRWWAWKDAADPPLRLLRHASAGAGSAG